MIYYPRLIINLSEIKNNIKIITKKCKGSKIDVVGVTKLFSGDLKIAKTFLKNGIECLGDSRIINLKKYEGFNCQKMLLRLPMISEIEEVIKYADISLNSEIETLIRLNIEAKKQNKIHKIVLMLELGDLREGILSINIDKYIEVILKMNNIKLEGVGVNLTCYAGILPDSDNLNELVQIANKIEKNYNIKLNMISGGNSSSLYILWENRVPSKINNLRLGESLIFGKETAYGKNIDKCSYNTVILEVEIIELKEKYSYPKGEIGFNAFGKKIEFKDCGERKRAILAIGRQDVDHNNLIAIDEKIKILGSSSDHLILDVTESEIEYRVGSVVSFYLDYSALLQLTTSSYVKKIYLN